MGKLTTHVLDVMHGRPGAGIRIELYSLGNKRVHVKSLVTNADGRCDEPVLTENQIKQGKWELVFHIGEYFRKMNVPTDDIQFLDEVPVRFGIGDAAGDYHVPLLASPWSYTTYRGS